MSTHFLIDGGPGLVLRGLLVARPTVIDETAILDAAREAFLERGFSVPTSEIAKRAGVSEGSIFKRYGTKAQLFSAALELPRVIPWKSMVEERFSRPDTKQAMTEIGVEVLKFYRNYMGQMLKIHAHLKEIMHIESTEAPPPIQALNTLTEFFTQQSKQNLIDAAHPEAVTRMFIGSIVNYAFFEIMFQYTPTPAEEYIEQIVDTLWAGVSPKAQA